MEEKTVKSLTAFLLIATGLIVAYFIYKTINGESVFGGGGGGGGGEDSNFAPNTPENRFYFNLLLPGTSPASSTGAAISTVRQTTSSPIIPAILSQPQSWAPKPASWSAPAAQQKTNLLSQPMQYYGITWASGVSPQMRPDRG